MRIVLIAVLVAVVITPISISQTGKSQKQVAQPKDTNPVWVRMDVTVEDKGANYILTSRNPDGGAIETLKANVEIAGQVVKLRVRDNTDVKVVKTPVVNKTAGKASAPKAAGDCVKQEDCPTQCGACVPTGFQGNCVRVCCGTGGARGIGLGVWGCP